VNNRNSNLEREREGWLFSNTGFGLDSCESENWKKIQHIHMKYHINSCVTRFPDQNQSNLIKIFHWYYYYFFLKVTFFRGFEGGWLSNTDQSLKRPYIESDTNPLGKITIKCLSAQDFIQQSKPRSEINQNYAYSHSRR